MCWALLESDNMNDAKPEYVSKLLKVLDTLDYFIENSEIDLRHYHATRENCPDFWYIVLANDPAMGAPGMIAGFRASKRAILESFPELKEYYKQPEK